MRGFGGQLMAGVAGAAGAVLVVGGGGGVVAPSLTISGTEDS